MSRAERPSKKIRRLSTDSEGSEEGLDLIGLRGRELPPAKNESSRPRRTVSENKATATVSRGPPPRSSASPQSMHLTVKAPASKLREATRTGSVSGPSGAKAVKDPFIGGQIVEGKRARTVRNTYVLQSDSDEDEEMEDAADEDAEAESIDEDDDDLDADDDGLADEDADGDIDMDDAVPTPPTIEITKASTGKRSITIKAPTKVEVKSVEQKEIDDGSDDEELSELDSDLGEEVEEEEAMQTGNEEDAEGEDEEIEAEEPDEDDDSLGLDSDDETPGNGSRAETPDITKMTKRQRARIEEADDGHLLALPDEVQVKKHLTAEEHAMRRAEMARRRKNLSEKRNEEEKMDTINKLLKKQAPKTNARRSIMNNVAGDATPDSRDFKPNAGFVRWVSNRDGNRIGVPEEWCDAPIGKIFATTVKPASNITGGKLIQEVS